MMVGLDTSVVLRLLIGEPADQAERAVSYLDELARRGDGAGICDLVVAEAYFALQYHYGVSKRDALDGLRQIFADGEIASLGVAGEGLQSDNLASAKPGFVDRLIHHTYATTSAKTATFEKSAAKLSTAKLL
jgi:predicted nucleic-acid-binding protein